jgi:predicted nucleic acid-binding Zn ribbon protein
LIGAGAGVIFRGSGFYQTDYRSESYRKAARKDKPSASTGDKGGGKDAGAKAKDAGKSDASKPDS